MKRSLKLLKTLTSFWITLTMAVSGLSGVVLCVGADGHFSLEPAHEGGCHSDADESHSDRHATAGMTIEGHDDCCSDCVDLSFSSDSLTELMRQGRQNRHMIDGVLTPAAGACSEFLAAEMPAVRPSPRPLHGLPPCAFLLAQRTVVLRT